MVVCLGQGADLHMAQLMSLPLTISCFLALPFWCRLTWVVLDNIQEGRKTIVCVCACVHACVHAYKLLNALNRDEANGFIVGVCWGGVWEGHLSSSPIWVLVALPPENF